MPQFFSNKRLILLLVGVIVLVALIFFSLRDRDHANLPEQIVKDVVGFGQQLFSKPAHYITDLIDDVDSLLNTYEENQRLRARLVEYAAVQAELSDIRKENERLKDIVGKEDDLRDFEPIHASVLARNPDQWEEKIVIDRGETHGIQKNMAVMTAQGLIGKVVLTTPFTSTVQLLATQDPDYRVSALVVGKTEAFGLVEGYDSERRELILRRIDASFEIKEGQKVISSGLGGIFPKGLLIGEITEVTTDDFGLTKQAHIKPAADFSMLEHVIIAKRKSTEVDGSDAGNTDEAKDKTADGGKDGDGS
ncbi:rod shape-determining protein MreC [Bhargavaea massiliensis]|uniref:rod shape-determining protein MreC n=1 Tax=Bhargavaea massiliensis TaxID=2697500 RepID=UPI001BCCA659|nr:rod shape-determining protein MreC [Bhargavaea massiliensis]